MNAESLIYWLCKFVQEVANKSGDVDLQHAIHQVATRLHGFAATQLRGYVATRLRGYVATRLRGYVATWLRG